MSGHATVRFSAGRLRRRLLEAASLAVARRALRRRDPDHPFAAGPLPRTSNLRLPGAFAAALELGAGGDPGRPGDNE